MWWWIEPLWCTGITLFFISLIWIYIFKNSEKFWPVVVVFILWAPIIVAMISEIVCILVQLFLYIWRPYI